MILENDILIVSGCGLTDLFPMQQVRSRFADSAGSDKEGIDALVAALTSLGFKQTSRDSSNKMFVILELKKISGNSVAGVSWPELKPCIYKRR